MLNLGILISGRGSNMGAILAAIRAGEIAANPALVVSDRPGAPGLAVARGMGVRTEVLEAAPGEERAGYDSRMAGLLEENGITPRDGLVCLAGFMRIVGPGLVSRYEGRMLNIHPSLLPSFPGLHAQRQALEHGAKYSGCTVHIVDAGTDTGPIVAQAAVPVLEDDDEDSLSGRILAEEHRIYCEAVRLFAEGRARVSGRRVRIA